MILYGLLGFICFYLYMYRLKIALISRVLTQFCWIWFLQWTNKQLVEVDEDSIVIKYVWNWGVYKVRISTKKCDNPVLTILDEKDNMMNERVLAYLGPAMDWHGQTISPGNFGCEQLILIHEDGSETIIK